MTRLLAVLAAILLLPTAAVAKPAEPGGTIAIADADLVYGGYVTYAVTTEPIKKGYYHTTTVCSQDGRVVYQWSSRDLAFSYPFIDQAGDGLDWLGGPADCGGWLVYRDIRGKKHTISFLDSVAFHVD
jgi:hypothetical protein